MAKNFGGAKKSETIATHIGVGGIIKTKCHAFGGRHPDNKESEG